MKETSDAIGAVDGGKKLYTALLVTMCGVVGLSKLLNCHM